MCLTRRFGDSGGDWELALPERRRRRSGRTQGGRRSTARKGSRFAPLARICSDAEDSFSVACASDTDVSPPPPPSSVLNLGRFWADPAGEAPPPPAVSPREGNQAPVTSPPPLESSHFPPLPVAPDLGRISPPAAGSGSSAPAASSFRVGELVVALPPCPGRSELREAPPPLPLGFACGSASVVRSSGGPPGPAQGLGPVHEAHGGLVGTLGAFGPAQTLADQRDLPTPPSEPSDNRHVASCGIVRSSAIRVPAGDDPTPPPPGLKWFWLPPETLDLTLAFPATSQDIRHNRSAAKRLTTHRDPCSGALVPHLEAMDRDRSYGKRTFDDYHGNYSRSREQDLRQKLDREQEEQRRQQRQRDRDLDRAGSSSWRSEGEGPRQDTRLPPPPPRGRDSGKNAGRRNLRQPRTHQGPSSAHSLGDGTGPGDAAVTNPDAAHITCYNCGKQGHIQADCTDEPFCVNCKKVGHLSAMCAAFAKVLAPFWAGFSGGRQGFLCVEVPEEELQRPASNSATVILDGGRLSEEEVEDEFKDLVDENWNWQVRQLSASDFAVVFPSKESLRIAIRGGGLTLPTSKIKALVTVPLGDPLASETLEEIWVKLVGVPPPLRLAERLLLSTREVGRPMAVDEDSLSPVDRPVRMSFGCRKGEALPESITIFVNLQGYRIKILRETVAAEDSPPRAPPSFPPGDDNGERDDEYEETDDDRWDGRRGKHLKEKRAAASAPSKGGNGPRKSVPLSAEPLSPPADDAALLTIPASARSQYGSNLTPTGNIFPLVAQIIKASAPSTSKHQPPETSDSDLLLQLDLPESLTSEERVSPTPGKALRLSEEDREEVGWVTPPSVTSDQEYRRNSERRSKSNHDRPSRRLMLEAAEAEATVVTAASPTSLNLHQAPAISKGGPPPAGQLLLLDAPIPALGAPVARAPRSKAPPVEAQRKSERTKGTSAGPVLERAIRATAEKNSTSKSSIDDSVAPSSATPAPVANGRRRKCNITSLVTESGTITDPKIIQKHVYDFYRSLLGSSAARMCGLAPDTWDRLSRVSEEENVNLALTFSESELEAIVKDMKTDTAPGPDGFPVVFFKRFWPQVKLGILHILNDFVLGRIDISRLNFGILSLIPKVPGADQITQYRPIALINVIFKIVSKAYASRLDPVAHRILSPNQTAFVKGRNILDGPLTLLEIIHDLRRRKHNGVLLKLDFEKAYDRVNWDFLGEVLRCKGFDEGYIHRILQLVSGGQTAISINGEVGPFFRNLRGVRQGDPLSPLLFNFIGEALSGILSAASKAGHIHGLVPHLLPGGVTHLQYADDTLILIQGSDEDIANLKFLLMCFEDMSGLKINYHKSEVFVLGQRFEERTSIANKLNCKLGSFPFIYLGLPISDRKLTLEQWLFLVRKLATKIEPWLGRLMSSGGRLILSNACLDNLPMFAMGLFLLHDGIHARFDSHRSKFFWEGAGPKRKYHLVNWPSVCRPKEFGGLGLLNTKKMNVALLLKWIWRLYQEEDTIWAHIIRAKYGDASDLFAGSGNGGSPFWKSLHKIKNLFKVGAKHKVRNGIRTSFWKDWWWGRGPLLESFPLLFAICDNQEISVADALFQDNLQVRFRRSLDPEGVRQWEDLQTSLAAVTLTTGQDEISWHLEQNGSFSVRSMYATLSKAVEPKMQVKRKGGLKLDGARAKGAVRVSQASDDMME
ncbi:hypothetical protein QYE76_009576 [Lolium multiflorum]|uniref:Reverse transcriptase domain-containing protein n=1 Tax=Lolium multiflorum TaxID=4521 RepID=A0AAD8TV99_LOLMU|nr:hypothetical protein QYE76_009576 [Lolium multiflorum]